jgi:AraC-like DNA-binding protein
MTESGVPITHKGEFNQFPNNVFSFNKAMGVSYGVDIDKPNQVKVKMSYPNGQQCDAYQMIFVLKGRISFAKQTNAIAHHHMDTYQHNLYRVAHNADGFTLGSFHDDIVCINLSEQFVNAYLPGNHAARQQLHAKPGPNALVMLFSANMPITPEMGTILQSLGSLSQSALHNQLLLESKAIELLALQIVQYEQWQASTNLLPIEEAVREKMEQARQLLIEHNGKQLSLRSLAHLVGTNEFNLKRDFKAVFGYTVFGYLNQYRMEQAKTLLINKDVTITEVSKKMGYKHATHFTSAFKKYFGYLPNTLKPGKLLLLMMMESLTATIQSLDLLLAC